MSTEGKMGRIAMRELKDILDTPCKLFCKGATTDIPFDGVLVYQNRTVIFIGRTEHESHCLDMDNVHFTLWGDVGATPITLLNTQIMSDGPTFNTVEGSKNHFMKFSPAEIIIGRKYQCTEAEILITKISANIQILNKMFSSETVDLVYDFSKEHPALVNYTFPAPITAIDSTGTLSIFQTIGLGSSDNKIEIPLIPCIEYTFTQNASIRTGISTLASVRNLFSFFANGYIPLENLSFADNQSLHREFCDNAIYLNSISEIESSEERFLITTDDFLDNFNEVWAKWCAFYSKKYIPTLFYEFICNKNLRINKFLNFAQAVEIFSNHYRNKEAQKIAIKNGWKINTNRPLPLKFRIEEIITFLNEFFRLSPEEISRLAQILSNARNFFTHYNEKDGKYVIPSFQELSAAGRVLHFMLLALVYRYISLDDSVIKKASSQFSYGTILDDIKIVLQQKAGDDMYE